MTLSLELTMTIKSLKAVLFTTLVCVSTQGISADLGLGIFQLNRGEYKAAMAEFEPLVTEGYAPAQYQMALIYQKGHGVRKDKQKAFELFSKAAAQNYPDALFDLALLYSEGNGVDKNLKTAFTLTEKAAKKGLASAQFNLAVMYANAQGANKDYKKAYSWYKKSAAQNYALAQFNLALMYFEGKGIKKSTLNSYVWNIIAARNGYLPAEKSRGMDEHKLSVADIERGREMAHDKHQTIIAQLELKARQAEQEEKRYAY